MIEAFSIILLCAILNRAGGKYNKNFRRWGIGLVLALYGYLHHLPFWYLCIATSHLFRLQITFKGDDITAYWYNWAWLPVVGFLYGLVPLPLALPGKLELALVLAVCFSVLFTLAVVLSNIKKTANIFKWQYVELFYGGLIGLMAMS